MQVTQETQPKGAVIDPSGAPDGMSPPARARAVRIALLIVIGTILAAWGWSRLATRSDSNLAPLAVVKDVPEFSLIGRDGRTVSKADLLGHVWVADFIFTTCAGPCPELSLRMRSLQQSLRRFGGDVKLVSFSVDPEYDQPPVLRAYAKRYEADPDLWWFLTCNDENAMHELVKVGFLQALSPGGRGTPIIHSTRFVLIDRMGRIRSWYDGLEASSKPLILRDVQRLLSEPIDG